MIRTGTLVVVRWAALAAMVCSASSAAAENLPSLARSNSQGWTSSDGENPFRDGNVAPAAWQPVRQDAPPPREKSTATAAKSTSKPAAPSAKPVAEQSSTRWLSPTAPAAQPRSAQSTDVRTPMPFTAPTDAQQIAKSTPRNPQPAVQKPVANSNAAAPRTPAPTNVESKQVAPANKNTGANLYSGSAARVTRLEERLEASAASPRSNPSNPRQVANRLQSTRTAKSFLDGEGWIRPLQQVAYQTSGEEEIPTPPGQKSVMSRSHRSSNAPSMPQSYYLENDPGNLNSRTYDGGIYDDGWIGPPGGSCGPDGCCGPMCGDACGHGCSGGGDGDLICVGPHDDESCHTIRVRVPKCQEFVVFGGVHGFKGPFDQNRDSGNFGFQEGANWGGKLPFTESGYQVGYQATQSQLSGDAHSSIDAPFTQHFWTTGLFHRTRDGLQGGIVWDLLLDSRHTTTDFHQLRGELSYVECGCHEFGVLLNVHLADQVLFDLQEEAINAWQSTDQYLLFYRMHGKTGGEGRFFVGLNDDSDAIIGADFLLPLKSHWSLQTGFTYLIPEEPAGETAARQEAWNLGINLVWHWGGRARECHSNPYRPLFNVADNGSMIIDDRP